jgi:hypothetical protein
MLLLVGVEGNLCTDIVKGRADSAGTAWAAIVLAAILALGIALSKSVQRWIRRNREFQRIDTTTRVARARALIALVSKKPGCASALDAARYHAEHGVLQFLWLLTSTDAEADAEWVKLELLRHHPGVTTYPPIRLANVYSIEEAKDEVEKIRKRMRREGVEDNDIICDFTGMTKHMSAGMIFACAPKEARLQYMHPAKFLPDGRADPEGGPSQPVEVQIAYQVEEE